MELLAYILAPFVASGTMYYLGKPVLDSIWNSWLTLLGKSGALGDENVQHAVYHLMTKVK